MREQFFYGHGKLLLTSEYFVMDGARSLALPTTVGQTLSVKYKTSYQPKLTWVSYDFNGNVWFEAEYDFWRFKCLTNESKDAQTLGTILQQARKLNPHFLRDDVDVVVETRVEFPLEWGLGSSSSLIYNVAQWAYVSPFELASKTQGGSGYDIACAQSMGPILFNKTKESQHWESSSFSPIFKDNLYFIYLMKKQNSKNEVEYYKKLDIQDKKKVINRLSEITDKVLGCIDLKEFEDLLFEHENLISSSLGYQRVQDIYFNDYWGLVKSLGAWGGDFALVTSNKSFTETREYFASRGFDTIIPYGELIAENFQALSKESYETEAPHLNEYFQ